MQIRLESIAVELGLSLARDAVFSKIGFLNHVETEQLSFIGSSAFLSKLTHCPEVSCVITKKELLGQIPKSIGVLLSDTPFQDFIRVHNYLETVDGFYYLTHKTKIGKNVTIHPSAIIPDENVIIGDNVRIDENVIIREHSEIGENSIICCGSIIGEGSVDHKVVGKDVIRVGHFGGVKIGSNVEVCAQAVISCNTFNGCVEIGDNTSINSQAFIAHNVTIGKRSNVGVASVVSGNVCIEDDVRISPKAIVNSDLRIGSGAHVLIGQIVTRDIPPNHVMFGQKIMKREVFAKLVSHTSSST
ncbi:MAG: hypothetical protein OQJ97_08055 [Rhodospirillales bacterium]|nr:hypothetical protein [Rhodospirillales bacterium]